MEHVARRVFPEIKEIRLGYLQTIALGSESGRNEGWRLRASKRRTRLCRFTRQLRVNWRLAFEGCPLPASGIPDLSSDPKA